MFILWIYGNAWISYLLLLLNVAITSVNTIIIFDIYKNNLMIGRLI